MNNRIIYRPRFTGDSAGQRDIPKPQQGIPDVRRNSWWQKHELPVYLAVLALITAVIGLILSHIEVGSGDYGQWLMLSRYYLGQDIPDYRHVSTVPPVMPLMLAAVRMFIYDPIVALQVFKGLLVAALSISFYLTGAAIFRSRGAGLLAVVFSLLVTDRVLELFAFGGLPQITALMFMSLGIAAFAQAGNCAGLRLKWWVLGSLGIMLAVMSHTGTGAIAIAAGLSVALISVMRIRDLTWIERGKAMAPLFITLMGLAIYWITTILPVNQEYTQNPASLTYRGPERMWELLMLYIPNVILLVSGAILIGGGVTWEVLSRRIRGYGIIGAWAMSTWAIVLFSSIAGIATDYPRFMAPMLVPLSIAAGGGITLLSEDALGLLKERYRAGAVATVPLILAGLLALSPGIQTISRHNNESTFYKTSDMADLVKVSQWLQLSSLADKTTLTTTREGKWIEGFTGQEALFSIPTRYSFRPVERARSVAAETLLRSTTSLTNEFFFIKYVDSKVSGTGYVPRDPWIGVNHGGEYLDLARIPSAESRAIAGDDGGVLATINALKAISTEEVSNDDFIEFRTVWGGERRGSNIFYTQTLTIAAGMTGFDMVEEVSTILPLQEVQAAITTVPGVEISSIEIGENQLDLFFPEAGKNQPHLRVSGIGQEVIFELADGKVLARSQLPNRLHLRFTVIDPGEPVFELGLFSPQQLVESYNIGAVVLQDSPALEARKARLENLGFVYEIKSGSYVVLTRNFNEIGKA